MKNILFFLLVLIFFSSNGLCNERKSKTEIKTNNKVIHTNNIYTYKILPTKNDTWCYDIYRDEKIFIHQTSIPGLPGNEGFKTKSAAEKVAKLVIEKLNKGEMPPSVTIEEMKTLKVL